MSRRFPAAPSRAIRSGDAREPVALGHGRRRGPGDRPGRLGAERALERRDAKATSRRSSRPPRAPTAPPPSHAGDAGQTVTQTQTVESDDSRAGCWRPRRPRSRRRASSSTRATRRSRISRRRSTRPTPRRTRRSRTPSRPSRGRRARRRPSSRRRRPSRRRRRSVRPGEGQGRGLVRQGHAGDLGRSRRRRTSTRGCSRVGGDHGLVPKCKESVATRGAEGGGAAQSAHRPRSTTWDASGRNPVATRGRQHAGGVDRSVDVGDRAASAAHEMVVLVGARVVDDRAALRRDATGQAERLEQIERGVHRRQRDAGHAGADLGVHVLGGDVPVEIGEDARDREPLRRGALPALAQRRGEGALPCLDHVVHCNNS